MIDSNIARYQSLDREAARLGRMSPGEAFETLRKDPSWRERVADRLYCEAYVNLGLNAEASLSAVAESLRRDPNSPLSWALWIVHTEAGYRRCALLSKLVERWPMLASLRYYDAFAWINAGQFEYAADECRVALALDPQRRSTWLNLAVALIELRDREGAAEATDRALSIPAEPSRVTPLASVLLWRAHRYGRALHVARDRARNKRTWTSTLLPWILPAVAVRTTTRIWWFTALFLSGVALLVRSPSGPSGVAAWSVFGLLTFLYVVAGRVGSSTGVRSLRKAISRSVNVPVVPELPGYLAVSADAARRPPWARPNPVRPQAIVSLVVLALGTILIAKTLSPWGNNRLSFLDSGGKAFFEIFQQPGPVTSSDLTSSPPAVPFVVVVQDTEGVLGQGAGDPTTVDLRGSVDVPDCELWRMEPAIVAVWDSSGSLLVNGPATPDHAIAAPACSDTFEFQTSVQASYTISIGRADAVGSPPIGPAIPGPNDPRVGYQICVVQGTGPCPPSDNSSPSGG